MTTESQRSEQQEWTPRDVQAICEKGCADDLTPEQAKVIAYAHNAALAAKDKQKEWTEGRVFAYFESEDFKGLARDINAAIIAERQRREQRERENRQLAQDYGKLNDKLLSAQAEIESVKTLDKAHDLLPFTIKKVLETVDLSLLNQHDAEVRKPLVEALAKVKGGK